MTDNLKGSSNINFLDRPHLQARVNLTDAQLKACFTAPITLLPAPGANKAIVLKSMTISYRYLTAAYTISGAPGIVYDGGTIATERVAALKIKEMFVVGASGVLISNEPQVVAGFLARTKVENKAIVLTDSADWTGGGGNAVIDMEYDVVDL